MKMNQVYFWDMLGHQLQSTQICRSRQRHPGNLSSKGTIAKYLTALPADWCRTIFWTMNLNKIQKIQPMGRLGFLAHRNDSGLFLFFWVTSREDCRGSLINYQLALKREPPRTYYPDMINASQANVPQATNRQCCDNVDFLDAVGHPHILASVCNIYFWSTPFWSSSLGCDVELISRSIWGFMAFHACLIHIFLIVCLTLFDLGLFPLFPGMPCISWRGAKSWPQHQIYTYNHIYIFSYIAALFLQKNSYPGGMQGLLGDYAAWW